MSGILEQWDKKEAEEKAANSTDEMAQRRFQQQELKALINGNPTKKEYKLTLDQALQLEEIRRLGTISNWMTFVGILVILGIILSLFGL